MADVDAGTVKVKFTGDASSLTKASGDSNKSLEALNARAVATGTILADFVRKGLDFASSLNEVTSRVASAADHLDNLAQETGISAERLESWSLMTRVADLNLDSLLTGMRTLSTTMNDGTGHISKAGWALRELGINATALGGDPEQILRAVADRFKEMPDGIEKSRFAMDLFGRAGLQLIPTLNQGAAGIDAMQRKTIELGDTLLQVEREALAKFKKASDENATAFEGFQKRIAVAFSPSTTASMEAFTRMWQVLGEWIDLAGRAIEKFEIFMGGLLAKVGVYKDQLLSTSVFSKEAWAQTQKQIDAINEWTRSQWRAVDAQKALNDMAKDLEKGGVTPKANAGAQGAGRYGSLRNMIENSKAPPINRQEELGTDIAAITGKQVQKQIQDRRTELELLLRRNEISAAFGTSLEQQLAQEELGKKIAQEGIVAYQQRNDSLEAAAIVADSLNTLQAQYYATDAMLSDRAGAARRVAFDKQATDQALATQLLEQEYARRAISYEIYQARLTALENNGEAARIAIVQQFPTIWEKQLKDLESSNAFSVSQIVSTWTSGIANSIVKGGNFAKQAWESTQVAIVQAALTATVQLLAQMALRASVELGIVTATEAQKLAVKTASNAAIVAGDTAAATASVGIWAGASAAIGGFFAATATGFVGLITGMMAIVTAVGTFIMGVLSAIASALTATVFGIPYAGAILAGVAILGAAIAAGVGAFANGGIVTGPTLGLMGEAGAPEAAIPLNERGAAFMSDMLGMSNGSGGKTQVISLEIDGSSFRRWILQNIPGDVRLRAGAIA
jgi:hypothetical protein